MLKMLSHILAHCCLYCRNITARGSAKELGDASAKIRPWALWLVTPLCCIWLSLLCRPAKLIETFSPEEFLYICFLQLSRGKACFIFLHVWQLEKNGSGDWNQGLQSKKKIYIFVFKENVSLDLNLLGAKKVFQNKTQVFRSITKQWVMVAYDKLLWLLDFTEVL